MATALQIAMAQGLDINELEGGAKRIAALAAESEREAMIMKSKVCMARHTRVYAEARC